MIPVLSRNITQPKTKGVPQGFKIPENKLTASSPIEVPPLPDKVVIPLLQHVGSPCRPIVKIGDKVLTGQKVGDCDDFRSLPVHASISGEVSDIINYIETSNNKEQKAIVLKSDGRDKWINMPSPVDMASLSNDEIIKRIREAGIVGMGGAIFPAHVKLSPPKTCNLDTLILNGCECEPYLTGDHRVMLEYGKQVISGLEIMMKLIAPDNVFIAIEDNKRDAIEHLQKIVDSLQISKNIQIVPINLRYPVGARELLVKILLGKEVPFMGHCRDIGVIVHNVSTAKAIHDAVIEGKPFIEEVITVTGAVKNPKNLLIRVGTPVMDLIEFCGGITGNVNRIILGGPMMGISQTDLNTPVTKGIRGIILKDTSKRIEQSCISCGECLNNCPMHLTPSLLAKYSKAGRYEDCDTSYIEDCIECGICSYVCPSNIPITQYIKKAKQELSLIE